jgi:hypothetical protein
LFVPRVFKGVGTAAFFIGLVPFHHRSYHFFVVLRGAPDLQNIAG